MKRCFTLPLAALVFASAALAQTQQAPTGTRQSPAHALRADLVVLTAPQILLDGQPDRLSPGARIYSLNRTTVVPASLSGQIWQVNYVRDSTSLVHEVWLLSSEEAAGSAQRNFRFGSDNATGRDDGKTPYHQLPGYPR